MKVAYRLILIMSLLANVAFAIKISAALLYGHSSAMRTFEILTSGRQKAEVESMLKAVDYKDGTDRVVCRLYYKHFPPWLFFVEYDDAGYVKNMRGVYN